LTAKRCTYKGIKFPSKLERDCYIYLEDAQNKGLISDLKRQIKFIVVGKIKHFVDFSCVVKDRTVYIEAKGRDLPLGKLKRLIVEEKYCLKICVVYTAHEIGVLLK
jgi:hypothetical protein